MGLRFVFFSYHLLILFLVLNNMKESLKIWDYCEMGLKLLLLQKLWIFFYGFYALFHEDEDVL